MTDHDNLTYWKTARNLNRRQARWYLTLSSYDFFFTHKPGKKHVAPDALTRRSGEEVKDAEDNKDVVMLKPEHFLQVAASSLKSGEESLENRIRQSAEKEVEVLQQLQKLKTTGLRKLLNGLIEWEEEDGLVYHKGKLYVPLDVELRRDVIKSCHDAPAAGHLGRTGTLELVDRHYWWPTLRKDVTAYVQGCDTCQRNKAAQHPTAHLEPLPIPDGLWEVVGQDLIVGLPEIQGCNAILTFVDHKGKQCHFIPCSDTITSDGIADIYYKEIFRLHGIPKSFVSDRGPQFASRMMRALLKRLGIQSSLTTAYHPQANGLTERMNKEVSTYLRLFCDQRQEDWLKMLPLAEFAINNRVNSSTGYSPFELMYGYRPNFTIPPGRTPRMPAVEERLRLLESARRDAEASLRMAKQHMTHSRNETCVKLPEL